jgi:hypothetical protein
METPVEQMQQEAESLEIWHHTFYDFILTLTETVKAKACSLEQMCDIGYLLREMEARLDELRKEVKARKELVGRIIAFEKTTQQISDPSIELVVRGTLAIGQPDVKMQRVLPKFGTPEFLAFTDFCGIPREYAEAGVVKISWKGMTEHVTKLMSEGKEVPPGLGQEIPFYYVTYRRRRSNGKEK